MLVNAAIEWVIRHLVGIWQRRAVNMVKTEMSEFDLTCFSGEDIINGCLDCPPLAAHSVIYDAIRRRSMAREWPDVIDV